VCADSGGTHPDVPALLRQRKRKKTAATAAV
jgi:hypothetical protein